MRYVVGVIVHCFVFLFPFTCADVLHTSVIQLEFHNKALFSHYPGCQGSEMACEVISLFMYELGCQETSLNLSREVFLEPVITLRRKTMRGTPGT